MILQALHGYYERMNSDPDSGMPPYGTSMENISFALVLDREGTLRGIEDLRELDGKKLRPRKMLVPIAEKKASGIKPNFLWDTTNYVLGKDDNGKQDRTEQCHAAFIEHIKAYCDRSDFGLVAVSKFLEQGDKDISGYPNSEEVLGTNVVFRIEGEPGFVHDRPAARKAWAACLSQREQGLLGQCLITGDNSQPIARLHPSIKGVKGGQPSGTSIVAFELASVRSYGKERSFNAPVSQYAAFCYVSALNYLLNGTTRQKITIGDATIVFWAERTSPAEDFLADLFDPSSESPLPGVTPDHQTAIKVRDLLQAIRSGKHAVDILPDLDESVHFYVLALAPNAARLSIRFWEVDTVGGLLHKIGRHFQDLEIIRQYDNEPEFPPLWLLLRQTATLNKSENISPVLAGGMAKAMLTGGQYPQSLLPVVLGRIRAEHTVTYSRAALIKAFLTRNKQLEVPVSLNETRNDVPYLLGRLFAALENAQKSAQGKNIRASIREKYISSASSNPSVVFSLLLRLNQHHINKSEYGFFHDRIIRGIMDKIDYFPSYLSLADQGIFFIGYYQQSNTKYSEFTKE